MSFGLADWSWRRTQSGIASRINYWGDFVEKNIGFHEIIIGSEEPETISVMNEKGGKGGSCSNRDGHG